jgi:hypothetical protein
LFFLFLVSFSLFAQQEGKPGCGTLPIEDAYLRDPFYGNSKALLDILREVGYDMPEDYLENLDTYGHYIGRDKDYGNKASAPVLREIPIKAWIYRNDNGNGNINLSQVYQVIHGVNQLFENNTNIRFYLLCEITQINNSEITNNGTGNFNGVCIGNKVPSAINVHFVIDSNANWSGKANFPTDVIAGKKIFLHD